MAKPVLTDEVIKVLDDWAAFDALSGIGGYWQAMIEVGYVPYICRISAYIVFIMMVISVLKTFVESGYSFSFRHYWMCVVKGAVVLFFFCLSYVMFSRMFVGFAEVLNDMVAGDSMREFRVSFRQFLFTLQSATAEKDVSVGESARIFRTIGNLLNLAQMSRGLLLTTMVTIAAVLVILFVFLFGCV